MKNYAESLSDRVVGRGFSVRQLGIVLDPITGSLGISIRGLLDGNVLFSFRPKFQPCPEFVL